MNCDEEQVYLEVFVLHLAAHLCGAQAILGNEKDSSSSSSSKKNFRTYWRSAPLLLDASSTKTNAEDTADLKTNGTAGEAEQCAFVDVTFEFEHDSAKMTATAETKSEPRIQMRWGSLWLSSREAGTHVHGRYFTGKPVTYQDLQAHFDDPSPLNADLKSNEASVLARQMAHALQSLTPNKAHGGGTLTPSCPGGSIYLYYDTLSPHEPAPLRVANTEAAVDDDSQQCSAVGKGLLDMMLLQHSASSAPSTPTEATKAELDKISKFIEKQWKPTVGADGPQKAQAVPSAIREPAAAAAAAAAAANPPPEKKQTDADGSAEKKRKVAPAPNKPVVFRAKKPLVTRVGGTKKKKKKNLYA